MANDQINVPSLLVILVLSGLIIRYLFFAPPAGGASSQQQGGTSRAARDTSAAAVRAREVAAERITQMFPQVDRRTALWDLQRNGANIQATSERILAGRLETVGFASFFPPVFLFSFCSYRLHVPLRRRASRLYKYVRASRGPITDVFPPLCCAAPDHLPAGPAPGPDDLLNGTGGVRGQAGREARAAGPDHAVQAAG